MNKINPTTNQPIREPDDGASANQSGMPARKTEPNTIGQKQTRKRTSEVTPEETAKNPELPAPIPKKSRKRDRTEPKQKEGSPAIKPCTNIGILETATRESLSEILPVADTDQTITLPPVPLYLITAVLSREIHTYNGIIREVLIRRAGQHRYLITIVTRAQAHGGVPDAD